MTTMLDLLNSNVVKKIEDAIADGTSHLLSERFNTLGYAQAVYPFVTSLDQEIDWAVLQAAANNDAYGHSVNGQLKVFIINNTLEINHNKKYLENIHLKYANDIVALWINDKTPYPIGNEAIAVFKPPHSFDRIIIEGTGHDANGKAIGTAIDTGSTSTNFWSGMGIIFEHFKVRHTAKFLNLNKQNTYMWHFSNGFVSEISDKCIHVIGQSNSGEALDFTACRFFNNPGTIIHSEAYAACTITLNSCSLDYSTLAVYAKNSCRITLNDCWIETNATMTPAEYFKLDTGAPQLIFNNCKFVLVGDWSGRNFIENNNGDVQINGGYFYFTETDPTKKLKRLINDSNTSSNSYVKNIKFATGEASPVCLGQTQNICYQGNMEGDLTSFDLTGANVIDTDVFYSGTKSLHWNHQSSEAHTLVFTFNVNNENKTVVCNFAYKLETVTFGFFTAIMKWYDIKDNVVNTVSGGTSETLVGAVAGTLDWTEKIRNSVLNYFRIPKGAVKAAITLTLDASCGSNSKVWIDDIEIWAI